MLTYRNQTYHGDHFEKYRNIESLCCVTGTNIVLQVNYTSKPKQANLQTDRKRDQICGYQMPGEGERQLDEGGKKVQTSSYKINKYKGCNHNMRNILLTFIYLHMKVKRVKPKSSHHKEIVFSIF